MGSNPTGGTFHIYRPARCVGSGWRRGRLGPARIEGLLCCHFIAMLIQALIERHIRAAMAERGLRQLSPYPEDRGCIAPTSARALEIFTDLAGHHLTDADGEHLKSFQPQLSPLQTLVLDLLDIPASVYTECR
ncbi:MAG: hypothetical protein ACRDWT_00755 [Jatrophihabitantaceae bacterium]